MIQNPQNNPDCYKVKTLPSWATEH